MGTRLRVELLVLWSDGKKLVIQFGNNRRQNEYRTHEIKWEPTITSNNRNEKPMLAGGYSFDQQNIGPFL